MTGRDKENIESVMEMNSPAAMEKIKARTNIKEGQTIQEFDFKDTQDELRQKLVELNQRKK